MSRPIINYIFEQTHCVCVVIGCPYCNKRSYKSSNKPKANPDGTRRLTSVDLLIWVNYNNFYVEHNSSSHGFVNDV